MSLAINVTCAEGIVLAADSRQTYVNRRKAARIGSDNASKIVQVHKRAAIAFTGMSSLTDADGNLRNVTTFIEDLVLEKQIQEKNKIQTIAEKTHPYFLDIIRPTFLKEKPKVIGKIKKDIEDAGNTEVQISVDDSRIQATAEFTAPDGSRIKRSDLIMPQMKLLLCGYDPDDTFQVRVCNIPGAIDINRDGRADKVSFGATWIGQSDVVKRIVLGYDSRIFNLGVINELIGLTPNPQEAAENLHKNLQLLQYVINWGGLALQDAIDFCTLAIRTTIAVQRFSDGISMDPGAIPGVGGSVDVCVIRRRKDFEWISSKELIVES